MAPFEQCRRAARARRHAPRGARLFRGARRARSADAGGWSTRRHRSGHRQHASRHGPLPADLARIPHEATARRRRSIHLPGRTGFPRRRTRALAQPGVHDDRVVPPGFRRAAPDDRSGGAGRRSDRLRVVRQHPPCGSPRTPFRHGCLPVQRGITPGASPRSGLGKRHQRGRRAGPDLRRCGRGAA